MVTFNVSSFNVKFHRICRNCQNKPLCTTISAIGCSLLTIFARRYVYFGTEVGADRELTSCLLYHMLCITFICNEFQCIVPYSGQYKNVNKCLLLNSAYLPNHIHMNVILFIHVFFIVTKINRTRLIDQASDDQVVMNWNIFLKKNKIFLPV